MGNVAKYEDKEEKITPVYEEVAAKYCNEPMSVEELAIYLSHKRGLSESPLNEKTVRGYITKLCSMSDGELEDKDFKDKDGKYCFLPKYHKILLAILDTDFFGGYKSTKSLSGRSVLHKQLADNIDEYQIDSQMQAKIKKDPSYLNALLETRLSDMFTRELAAMVHSMYNADYVVQYQFLIEGIDRVVALRRWMREWEERMSIIRCELATTEEEKKQAKERTGKYKDQSMDTLMIRLLSSLVKDKEYVFVSEDEELSYPATYVASQTYDVSHLPNHELSGIFDQMEENVSNDERYKVIMEMAALYFHGNSYLEKEVLTSFSKVLKSQLVIKDCENPSSEYKKMIRFIEDAFVEKKQDIRSELEAQGESGLDESTLRKNYGNQRQDGTNKAGEDLNRNFSSANGRIMDYTSYIEVK